MKAMPKFRIGFPVLSQKEGAQSGFYLLGLTANTSSRPLVRLETESGIRKDLRTDVPFNGNNHEVKRLVEAILQSKNDGLGRILTFHYNSIGCLPMDGSNADLDQIDIQPYSAGAALRLVSRLDSLDGGHEGADATAFISAMWDDNRPAPLMDADAIFAKIKVCVMTPERPDDILFLCQSDIDSVKRLYAQPDIPVIPDSIWGTRQDLKDLNAFQEAHERGCRIFPLPVTDSGHWNPVGHGEAGAIPFEEGLARLLGLTLRKLISKNAQQTSLPKNQKLKIVENSPAELFITAANDEPKFDSLASTEDKPDNYFEPLAPKSLGILETLPLSEGEQQMLWLPSSKRGTIMPNILISGPTGSGKTLLAQALMINAVAREKRAIYVAPTRALVDEVWGKLNGILGEASKVRVIRSTGENCEDDWRFTNADFDIACIVNEKANVILPMNSTTLDKLGLVVIDEIHMLEDLARGGVLDMLLAKLKIKQAKNLENMLPRLVAITTEGTGGGGPDILSSYLARSAIPTLSIKGQERPQKVSHKIVFCKPEGGGEEFDLVEFEGQDDRQMSVEKIATLKRACKEKILGMRSQARCHNTSLNHKGDIILELANDHHSFIVAGSNKSALDKLCEYIWSKRAVSVNNGEDRGSNVAHRDSESESETSNQHNIFEERAADILKLHEDCDLPEELCKKWHRWARQGIFIHNADLPKQLRHIVETLFRSSDEFPFTPIVFCTETLSYGVNLRSDGLALLNLNFPRADLQSGATAITKWRPLSPNQYHNILGRIGRYAQVSHKIPTAYIILDSGNNDVGEDIETLFDYYAESRDLESMAILYEDKHPFDEGEISKLDELPTFVSFRTAMDALRMAEKDGGEKAATAKDVTNKINMTFFAHWCKHNSQGNGFKWFIGWEGLVGKILDLAAKETFQSLKLIEKNEAEDPQYHTYHLLPQGEALIDTGIHWNNIRPMAEWIDTLNSLGIEDAPVELLLPALLSCDEILSNLLRTAMRLFIDDKGWLTPDKLASLEEAVIADLNAQFDKILKDVRISGVKPDIIGAIKNFIHASPHIKNIVGLAMKSSEAKTHAPIFFMRILSIVLYWIAGEHQKMDSLTRNPAKMAAEPPLIPAARFESISWAAQMCAKFFPAPEKLTLNQVAELALLSLRLRAGVPLVDLPLARGNLLDSGQIRILRNKGITADKILELGRYPDDLPEGRLLPDASKIHANICHFYLAQYQILQSRLARDWDRKLDVFLEQFFKDPGDADAKSCQEFCFICGYNEGVSLNEDHKEVILTLKPGKKTYKIAIRNTGRPKSECDAICYLPWKPETRCEVSKPIFTPGAVFALRHLAEDSVAEFMASGDLPQIVSANLMLRKCASQQGGMDALAIIEPFTT